MSYVVFDFDGVIGDTYKYEIEFAENDIITAKLMKSNNINSIDELMKRCCLDYNFSQSDDKEADIRYQKFLEDKPIQLFHEVIEILLKTNINISIVSGNNSQYIKKCLSDSMLKIQYILGINEGISKIDKINSICSNLGIDSIREVIYITDTVADYIELEGHVNNIYVCSWGFQKIETIKLYIPKIHILTKFEDLLNLMNII